MSINGGKWAIYLLVIVVFMFPALACRIEPPRIVLDDTPTPVPTMIITQVVTEVIVPTTAVPPPATPLPPDPVEPSPTPTWDPLSAPIYYPLPDCVASRLHVGDTAAVSSVGGANAIRIDTNLRADTNIVAYAEPGETMTIIGGPECSDGFIVWFVELLDGTRGYTPEGDGNSYWLWPVGP
jgi:hypothetical protein